MTDVLAELTQAGVSVWLDDISRERLRTGNLQTLINDFHVRGVTSNPTIFASALAKDGISARVVSMPSVEWFNEQDASYHEEVLPAAIRARVSVEAGITPPWKIFVGDAGESIGVDHYGASAAAAVIYEKFGITAEAVAAAAKSSIAKARA